MDDLSPLEHEEVRREAALLTELGGVLKRAAGRAQICTWSDVVAEFKDLGVDFTAPQLFAALSGKDGNMLLANAIRESGRSEKAFQHLKAHVGLDYMVTDIAAPGNETDDDWGIDDF